MWHEEKLLIAGDLVPAEGNAEFPTIDPSTGETLGVAADATVDDARKAVAAARHAFDTTEWSRDHSFRQKCLRQLQDALGKHQEDLRELLMSEVGAPRGLTHGPHLDIPIQMAEWYADLLDRYEFSEELGNREMMGVNSRRWVEREAAGVVAAIVPYNYPVQITLAKLVPALAAGCTVVVKSPPDTPWVSASLGRIIAEHTDIPAGVVNQLTSQSHEVGKVLTTDPHVDMISFTGSTPTGRAIMAAASDTVKKVFLELGGKSALIILDDADVPFAGMIAGFTICSHAGQGCAITSRMLVPESKYDELVQSTVDTLAGIDYGDPRAEGSMMGPLINPQQWDKVDGYVKAAVAEGATVAVGGKRPEHLPKGNFYEPTVLAGVTPDSKIAQEEVFGPVLAVIPYKDDDEAIAIANDSDFGLSGGVFGADNERATNIARRIRTGTVSINGGIYYGPDAPFGGYKQSGIGREMGVAGFEEYLEMKTLAIPAD